MWKKVLENNNTFQAFLQENIQMNKQAELKSVQEGSWPPQRRSERTEEDKWKVFPGL